MSDLETDNKKRRHPELLIPASSLEVLKIAVVYGADAVYIGGEAFGLRAKAKNFSLEEMAEGVEFAHKHNVKVYVTANILAHNRDLPGVREYFEELKQVHPDALIISDPAIFTIAKEILPDMEIHISTQANNTNYGTFNFWYGLGAKRVVTARELSLEEINEIRKHIPEDMEIETFVHGAMCISYSGRCLLSSFMAGRDANQGACTHPCRWKYSVVEESRPGEYMPVYENQRGTYIFNSKDLCMIEHIPELVDSGIDSLKIEGWAKSAYYAAIVTGAYRHAIDAAASGVPLDPVWRDEVEHISHRHYSTGFFYGQPGQFTQDARYVRDWQIVAKVMSCDGEGNAVLTLNNKFAVGDTLELVGPEVRPQALTVEALWDGEGTSLDEVRHPQMVFQMKLPRQVPPLSLLRRKADLSP